MANEVLYTSLGDLTTTEVIAGDIRLLLADRESFFMHPCALFLGDQAGKGSTTDKVTLIGLDGYNEMSSVAEGASVSNTALTDASATCAVARQALQYEMSDLAMSVDSTGAINPERFSQSMAQSANMRLMSMFLDVTDGFTSFVGSTGVDMSHDDFMDAEFTLELASVPGPYIWAPHPRQYADWQNSLRAETGATQWMAATAEQLMLRGPGFKGSYNGIDVFVSSKVPTANAGADRASGMWGVGAVGYKVASVRRSPGKIGVFAGPVFVGFERNESGGLEKIVGNLYAGTVLIETARGVSIITDA